MFRSYLTYALRGFRRRPGRTAINVLGLALGLACSLLIGLFVADELSYDDHHEKADRIYRIATEMVDAEDGSTTSREASTFFPLAPEASSSISGIEHAVRFYGSNLTSTLVTAGDVQGYEDHIFAADAEVFDVFSIELIAGAPATALEEPNTVVISESSARTYFGDSDPLGESVTFHSRDYEVTGVMRDMPANTHLRADMLSSFATHAGQEHLQERGWMLLGFYTYLLLEPGVEPDRVRAEIAQLAARNRPDEPTRFILQPLTDIHLKSHLSGEIGANGDIRYVRIFGLVAVLILLVACVNYMNLASANTMGRAAEVGIRKSAGARRPQIVAQFLTEAALLSICALVAAGALVETVLPWFNDLTGKSLSVDYMSEGLLMAAVALGAGLFAGSYPAAVFSGFEPVRVLRGSGSLGAGRSSGLLRRSLVVFQFTTSIALITATIVVQRQMDFVSEERLGFNKERLVSLHSAERLEANYPAFKDAVLAHAGVEAVTTTTNVPGQIQYNHYGVRGASDGGEEDGELFHMLYTSVDFTFVETLGLNVVEGRDLSPEFGSDADENMLVNESAARKMGWDEPLGQELFGRKVVGVVSDYLSTYSKEEIDPAAFIPSPEVARYVVVRLAPGWNRDTIDFLSETWSSFVPSAPADLSFVDADIEALYQAEERLARVFTSFSLLAVLIACLGLFGLAAFSVERRTREIGIRKVLGASVTSILSLLSREYVALVALSLVIGGSTAWFFMEQWLSDYAYRIDLGPGIPAAAGLIALAIALGTVFFHAGRAALADPVDCLRTG